MIRIKKKTKKDYCAVAYSRNKNGKLFRELEVWEWETPIDVFSTLHEFGHIALSHWLGINKENKIIDVQTGKRGKVWEYLMNELDAWIYALGCVKDKHKVDCMNEAVDCLYTYIFDYTAYTALFIEYFEERIERFNFPENEVRRWAELLGLLETSESLEDY